MSRLPVVVTGASGGVGGRVASHLAARGVATRLVVRDAARAPRLRDSSVAVATYDEPEALRAAFDGARVALLVSAGEHPDRVRQHLTLVDAAADAGVERVVYTSFLGAAPDCVFTLGRHHWLTEQRVRERGLGFTFLRDSIYAEAMVLMAGSGVLRGPAGQGRLAPVARDDVAEVAVEALLDEGHAGQTYDVTGPELMTLGDVAAVLSDVSGRDIAYVDETEEEAYASRAVYGAPHWEVEGWVTSYQSIAAGEMAVVSDAVEQVTGHPPVGLRELLARDQAVRASLVGG